MDKFTNRHFTPAEIVVFTAALTTVKVADDQFSERIMTPGGLE